MALLFCGVELGWKVSENQGLVKACGWDLSRSVGDLHAVHRALREHRSVKAAIEVESTGAAGRREDYSVTVVLTWR